MTLPTYEVFAIKYAQREARRAEHFIGGDPHDAPMPMDYYVWLIRDSERVFLLDTGFTAAMAAQRKREYLRSPKEGLALLGVQAEAISQVLISHMHYDHAGTLADFPNATFHIQDEEMRFVTGRYMRHGRFKPSFEVEDVVGMVKLNFKGRVEQHKQDFELADGITLHHVGGHTPGLQIVRVMTKRGWVVLASDAAHYYEHLRENKFFVAAYNLGNMIDAYRTAERLAASPDHIIPGHDPEVMRIYPAVSKELEGIIVRLDVSPRG